MPEAAHALHAFKLQMKGSPNGIFKSVSEPASMMYANCKQWSHHPCNPIHLQPKSICLPQCRQCQQQLQSALKPSVQKGSGTCLSAAAEGIQVSAACSVFASASGPLITHAGAGHCPGASLRHWQARWGRSIPMGADRKLKRSRSHRHWQ